jgi:hypothetical protein
MGTRWQRWLWHIGLALIVGVVVFATSVLASWIHMREPGVGSTEQRFTQSMMESLDRDLHTYHDEHGEWPESLCDLHETWCAEYGEPYDGWQRPLIYSVRGDGFELRSLGRDARPGGIGLDADLYSDHRNEQAARLPFRQFFHDTPTGGNRVFCLLIAVVAAAQYLSLQYLLLQFSDRDTMIGGLRQAILLTTTLIVAATALAFLVTPSHIPSGL